MSLTPQQIEEMDRIAGVTSPTSTTTSMSSIDLGKKRAEEIRLLVQKKQKEVKEKKNIPERIGEDIKEAGSKIQEQIMGEGEYSDQSPVRRGVGAVSTAAQGVTKVATEILPKPVRTGLEKIGETLSNAQNWLGEKIGDTKLVQDLVEKYPEATNFIEEIAGTAKDLGVISGTLLAGKGLETGLKSGSEAIESVVKKIEKRQAIKDTNTIKDLTRKIVQGTTKDIEVGKRVLGDIDIENVKTYQDLKNSLISKEKSLSTQRDVRLDLNKDMISLEDLKSNFKIGDKTISKNFVEDALKDLKTWYESSRDVSSLERIRQLENKAKDDGLSLKEVNNLSIEYGNEIGGKAFDKLGQPKTSISAQSAENTRSGLKDTIRQISKDPILGEIDSKLSDVIRVKKLSNDMVEKVNKLKQKIEKRGFLEKTAGNIANLLDTLTAHTIRGFAQKILVPRTGGLKIMNSLDLEKSLNKNLNKLQKLIEKTDVASEKEILNDLTSLTNYSEQIQTQK